jgi:carbon starvation protein
MSLPLLALLVIVVLSLGYHFYGGFVARQYRLDPNAETPARRVNDGADFVPTEPVYLLPQHFSAIAAAGPIAGPILAAQQFGWLPCVLWIGFGVVFIGAVHDFSTLVASVRHDARSIADVVRAHLGKSAYLAIMTFILVALIYVILAFTDVTASTFVSGDADTQGLGFRFNPGGAVAAASIMYLALAVLMGVVDRFLKPPLWLQTAIFVPATLAAVWLGTQLSTVLVLDAKLWAGLILAYCFVGSLVPVWALLQPRGYLGGFVLYLAIAAGTIGTLFGGFDVKLDAFRGFSAPGATGALFPFLFVTIACGACSGFHGLVCSGTTSKQISRETHCKPIGYGAMLLEAFVAIIALATIMIATPAEVAGKAPGAVYGQGLGRFLAVVIGQDNLTFAVTFGAMAFSTFVFDTLDVCTRLGRYILQELFGWKGRAGALAATAIMCLLPFALLMAAGPGSYRWFWTLFGTSNQLLAGLSLIVVSVWLKGTNRRYWYTLIPAVFVLGITLWSLVSQMLLGFAAGASRIAFINALVAIALLGLAFLLMAHGARSLLRRSAASQAAPAVSALPPG